MRSGPTAKLAKEKVPDSPYSEKIKQSHERISIVPCAVAGIVGANRRVAIIRVPQPDALETPDAMVPKGPPTLDPAPRKEGDDEDRAVPEVGKKGGGDS